MPGGKRLYCEREIRTLFGEPDSSGMQSDDRKEETKSIQNEESKKRNICYARVSSQHQKADIDRQVQFLQEAYPHHELIQDIGSSRNLKRKGFVALLDQVHTGVVETVVVQHRDRLCRFGLELVDWIFAKAGAKLVVHSEVSQGSATTAAAAASSSSSAAEAAAPAAASGSSAIESSSASVSASFQREEFADDVLSIITFFVARNNGRCSTANRRERTRLREGADQGGTAQADNGIGTARKETKKRGHPTGSTNRNRDAVGYCTIGRVGSSGHPASRSDSGRRTGTEDEDYDEIGGDEDEETNDSKKNELIQSQMNTTAENVEEEKKSSLHVLTTTKKHKTTKNSDPRQYTDASMDMDDGAASAAVWIDVPTDEDVQPTVKEPACRTIRYKLHPTADQMVQLRKAFGVTTWTYNQCLDGILQKKIEKRTIGACRAYALNAQADLIKDKAWVTEVPYDIRDEAVQDLLRAYKSHDSKVAKGDKFAAKAQFKFQSKYRKSKKLVIHSKHYKAAGVFWPSFFGPKPFRCNERLPESIAYSANLTINWLGQVHLHIPRPLQKRAINPATKPVAAIDPGVRTFGTVFDPEANQYIEWGKGDMSVLAQIGLKMDRLKSRMTSDKGKSKGHGNIGHRKRYRLNRVFRRLAYRIQNMVKDFHYRFANWLCQNYKVILLPYYEVSRMVTRLNRKIRCKTVRGMLTWSSCLFRDRLMGVSRCYPDSHIIQLSEAYTTKTCRCCGFQHKTIGGSAVFKCPSCKVIYGRDDGGASNILLRYLTLLHEDLTKSSLSAQIVPLAATSAAVAAAAR